MNDIIESSIYFYLFFNSLLYYNYDNRGLAVRLLPFTREARVQGRGNSLHWIMRLNRCLKAELSLPP